MTKLASHGRNAAKSFDNYTNFFHGEDFIRSKRITVNVDYENILHDTLSTMEKNVTQQLKALRDRAGLSMEKMAKDLGYRGASSYQRYEDDTLFEDEKLPLKLVKKLLPILLGKGVPPITSREIQLLATDVDSALGLPSGLSFGGIAEAGTYRPVDLLDQLGETRIISLPRDPRFPKAKQYAFEIRGDSMTEANLYEGMWAVAIDYHDYTDFYGDLRDGANVVISRSRNGDPERELSVKELKVFRDRTELHPRSKNPKHTVQVFPAEHNPENPVEIEILAVVANAVWLMKI
jgi:SOS-response transcriptional repressor LexA